MKTAYNKILSLSLSVAMLTLLASASLHAAAPLAGTSIGNQASATYTDDTDETRTATSNTVITIVQQVAAFTLIQNNTRTIAPGGTVYFPHTITNRGNGTDSFDVSAIVATGNFIPGSVFVYADTDNNGIPDSFTPIANTGNVAAGASYNFVVAATMPGAQTAPHTSTLTVSATSDFSETVAGGPTQTQTNTDTANVTADAVMIVTKAISIGSGFPGTTPVTYTLTYTNTGNNTATDFEITDTIPTGMTYIATSGRWSVTGAGTPLTDATADTQGTAPNTIDYSISGGVITAVISQVPPGQSGSLTFQVGVNLGIPPQVINNTAYHTYDPDGPGPGDDTPSTPTNTVPFTVLQQAVVIADDPLSGATPNSDDTVVVNTAVQGATVSFTNRVVNMGNGPDTFDMTFVSNNFPAGTTFQFFKADGNTPLVDTNGNSIPDTGVLQPGGPTAPDSTYLVVVKAFLPANATVGGPYTLTKRATSGFNPAVSDTVQDVLTAITGKTVDLTNNAAQGDVGALGEGSVPTTPAAIDNAGAPFVTNSTNPGTTTTFVLYARNTSTTADTYQLASNVAANFSGLAAPAGWSVVFRNDNAGSPGGIITNTGSINAGASVRIYAEVTVPQFTTPGVRDLYFRVLSPTSGAYDIKRDAINVNTVRNISIVSNNAGQVFPGGSAVYAHLLTNNGNVDEATGSPSIINLSLADSLAAQGWNSVIFWDKNGDGNLDPADPAVSTLNDLTNTPDSDWNGLSPNETQRFFVKVFAPLQANALTVNVTTITATVVGGAINGVAVPAAVSNQDTTTVVKGDVILLKEQALDADSNGIADGAFTTLTIQAKPGESVVYRITVTNSGNTDADGIQVFDSTPASTTYNRVGDSIASVNGVNSVAAVPTEPANNATGSFVFNVGTLTPNASAIIRFGVTIDPIVP